MTLLRAAVSDNADSTQNVFREVLPQLQQLHLLANFGDDVLKH
jgi:hypothetical protein